MSKRNRKSNRRRFRYTNDHAAITVLPLENAYMGGVSFTSNRDDQFGASIATDSSNSTTFRVRIAGTSVSLSGRQARTLQRLLNKHYGNLGRSPALLGSDETY